ncbi:MAG: PilC/PilY family type IV pilus protein [Desulfobacterales bacterium]|jgi:type IV pilus assembly protein PilY1|nr:PilC/PilY family type IV pilus protein [Desulfobacterales bacterium]
MNLIQSIRMAAMALAILGMTGTARTDDTCVFATTADDVPPNIVILLDNGASMEEITWHPLYNNSASHTPSNCTDVVQNSPGGIGFCRDKGYATTVRGGKYYLAEIPDSLVIADSQFQRMADGDGKSPVWTINNRSIALPAVPANHTVDGVIDKAANFRYSRNYLNWIFYGPYSGSGSDLPGKTRFYYAKKALMTVAKLAANRAQFSIYNFTANASGASRVQPLGLVVAPPLAADPADNILDSNYINNINNMGTVTYSPLAEGLATIGGYYNSPSSQVVATYCTENFALVVSPGLSSEDQSPAAGSFPSSFSDYDGDQSGIGEGKIKKDLSIYDIPVNRNGSTHLDDVAYALYTRDVVGYRPGLQNLRTYTVGFMGDVLNNLFLINTSNNGNGKLNLYDSADKYYGKYHYVAENPDQLATAILSAVMDIISQTNSFTAPVVPVTRTTSGNRIYMAFFKPGESNFWEGNLTKFALSPNLEIVDKNNAYATWPNGAIRNEALPYWQTKDWATPGKSNYIHHADRIICTYLGAAATRLLDSENRFSAANPRLTAAVLGSPAHTTAQVIDYIRGADEFDEDADGNRSENRAIITGDILHSEPSVFRYSYPDGSTKSYVFFGSNDGMLHAVYDESIAANSTSAVHYGTEAWAFIPPDLLPRLKAVIEGGSHPYYVDASPKVYFMDINQNGLIDPGDRVVLVCGERKGGSSYFALDITDPDNPHFLWRIAPDSSGPVAPSLVIPELGQSWSEPQFGVVKTSDLDTVGTPVFFIGGGFSPDNSSGRAVLAISVFSGAAVRVFKNDGSLLGMNFAIPSSVALFDANDNGFVDKVYVGDLGGRLWRFGKFTTSANVSLPFPDCDENIMNWEARILFSADGSFPRKFFYPPALTLEKGYDLLFIGSGDREDPCSPSASDRFYVIRDRHETVSLTEADLVDVTSASTTPPCLDDLAADADGNGRRDQGWFLQLGPGEKVLSESLVFFKTVYLTTLQPNSDPCVPGGYAHLYALHYKTAAPVLDFNNDATRDRSVAIGGGIPSRAVPVITDSLSKLLISVGSTNADEDSESFAAGVVRMAPLMPSNNFFYRWWRELLN